MNVFYFIFMAILLLGCQNTEFKEQVAIEPPNIEIQINNLQQGQAYLIGFLNEQQYRVDSTNVNPDGRLQFVASEPYPPGLYYAYLPNDHAIQLLIDKDQTFKIRANANQLQESIAISGNLDSELLQQNLVFEKVHQSKIQPIIQAIKNPTANTDVEALKLKRDQLIAERETHLNELFQQYPNSFFTHFKRAGQNPKLKDVKQPDGTIDNNLQVFYYRTEFWDNVDFNDDRLLNTPVIINKLKRYITKLTVQRHDSIIKSTDYLMSKVLDRPKYYQFFANWITLNYDPSKASIMDPEAIYVHMIQNYFTHDRAFWSDSTTIYGLQLRAGEMEASLIGKRGPDVNVKDSNGQMQSISNLNAPYIIVYLYNPDCDHCQEETPKLVQYYNQNKNQAEVYAIAIDTDDTKWKDFISKFNMSWTNVFDATNRAIYKKYYVNNTPEIYVLNPSRTIIGKNLKVEQIQEVIERDRIG